MAQNKIQKLFGIPEQTMPTNQGERTQLQKLADEEEEKKKKSASQILTGGR